MSWSTPPSATSRKPKIQQTWDGPPAINLYDPSRNLSDETSIHSPRIVSVTKKNIRKANNKYALTNTVHQMSDPGIYHMAVASKSPKSPKSPNSQTFEFELSTTPQHFRSPLKSVSSNRRQYEDSSTSDSAPSILTSPMKKYEYNAVSPKFEGSGKISFC